MSTLKGKVILITGQAPCSYPGIQQYSFDFAQQIFYSHHAQQVGPLLFKTPRKCKCFGGCSKGSGASSGIGKGIALHFARLGCRLAITGRDADNLEKVAVECKNAGLSDDMVVTVAGDFNNEDVRAGIVKKTVDTFGEINVLVNNAGMGYSKNISSITPDEYDTTFNTNTRSQVFLTKLVLPYLIKSKGNIVNNSSYISQRVMPAMGPYCMSKASLDMFTQCLALEMAPHGVRVNSINPGVSVSNALRREYGNYQDEEKYQQFLKVQAPLHPLGRVGQPEDCAEAVEFLASDAASFITGQILFVDGGRHCVSDRASTD